MSTYYTNGKNERRFNSNEIVPDGWYKGRLVNPKGSTGYKWYTNDVDNILILPTDNIPSGYHLGRTKNSLSAIKQSITLKNKNLHWYNNGAIENTFSSDNVPEGYVLGRLIMSDEQKSKLSKSHIGLHHTEDAKLKISKHSNNNREKAKETCLKKYGVDSVFASSIVREKAIETKRINNTINSSKPEKDYYKLLCEQYGKNNVKKHYKCNRYPFYCDFYIIPEDKFIELNLHWTHGEKPFDELDKDCLDKLSIWQEKAKTSQFYQNAIQTWTVRDVEKQKVARENNLNYECIYKL